MRFTVRSFAAAVPLAFAIALASRPVVAGTSTSNPAVVVVNDCVISSGSLAFGNSDGNPYTSVDGNPALTVTCTTSASYTLTLGQGSSGASGSTDAAPLRGATDGSSHFADYSFYQDSARTATWVSTAGSGVRRTSNGSGQTVTVYGDVPTGQMTQAGTFTGRAHVLALAVTAPAARAGAPGVEPLQIRLDAGTPTAVVRLQNREVEPVRYEVHALASAEGPDGEIRLSPTDDVQISPSLVTLTAGETRSLRVDVRGAPGAVERTYRLIVEELPPVRPAPGQVMARTKLSVPVSFAPQAEASSVRLRGLRLADGESSK